MALEPKAHSTEGRLEAQSWAQTAGLIAGALGLTAALFGVTLYTIDPSVLPLAAVNLAFGVFGIVVYALTNRGSLRRRVSGRSTLLLFIEAAALLGWLALVGAVNFYGKQSPKEWDLTQDGLYSLHPQSIQVAEALPAPITVYGFYRPSAPERGVLQQAVDLYRQHSAQLSVRFINPDAPPAELLERFKLSSTSPRVVVEAKGGRFVKLRQPNEESLTNALIDVSQKEKKAIYIAQGHGEPAIEDSASEEGFSQATDALRSAGWDPRPLPAGAPIPKDAALLILAAPDKQLLQGEQVNLRRYLSAGGRLLMLLEPGLPPASASLLADYGVEIADDLVIEPSPEARAHGFSADAPILSHFEPHPITRTLMRSALLFYRARSVMPKLGAGELDISTLISSGPNSWAETRYPAGPPALDELDQPGPIPVAVAVKRRVPPGQRSDEARLVVIGDVHFAENRFAPLAANTDLLLNAAHWLLGEEDKITIRPRPRYADRLSLSQAQHYGIMFFSLNLLPLLILGLGYSVWALRRRR